MSSLLREMLPVVSMTTTEKPINEQYTFLA